MLQVCVVTKADSPGYCACPFQDIEVQSCDLADAGKTVTTTDVSAYCNVMMNSAILSTSNIYVSWKDLAVTSCAILDTAKTYCYKVDTSGGVQRSHATTSIVGFDLIATGRRRLLEDDDEYDNSMMDSEEAILVNDMLWNASWSHAGEPCRSLVHAYRFDNGSMGGVMDRYHLKECLHWRLITNQTITAYNWTTVAPDDVFALSWHGISQVPVSLPDPLFHGDECPGVLVLVCV